MLGLSTINKLQISLVLVLIAAIFAPISYSVDSLWTFAMIVLVGIANDFYNEYVSETGSKLEAQTRLKFFLLAAIIYWFLALVLLSFWSSHLLAAITYEFKNLSLFSTIIGGGIWMWLMRVMLRENNRVDNLEWEKGIFELLKFSVMCAFAYQIWRLVGYDDGCTTFDSDPLFGGGGYEICDREFVKFSDQTAEIVNAHVFNVAAFHSAEFIIRTCIMSLATLLAYCSCRK